MPSASNNQNKNKLMKQTSVGSQKHTGGGGGGGGAGAGAVATSNAPVNVAAPVNSSPPVIGEPPMSSTVEKCASGSNASGGGGNGTTAADANNPLRQVLITIDHKIRNLEKRKTKLESYQAIQANGKELSSDQKAAVAKYDAVMATLDFARDLSKQMVQFSKEAEKEQKKQARKETLLRAQVETAKIREVLIIQNILSCFADETVRADFLNGDNGAVKLDVSDMELLEQFCADTQTRRPEASDDPSFVNVAQKVAEYFSMTIDGRPKQYGETTFENMRRIFNQIQECGYLDKIYLATSETCEASNEEEITAPVLDSENDAALNADDAENVEQGIKKLTLNETGKAGLDIVGNIPANMSSVQTADVPIGTGNKMVDMGLQPPSGAAGTPMVALMQGPNQHSAATTTPVHMPAMYAATQNTAQHQQQGGAPMAQVIPGNLITVPQSVSGTASQIPGQPQRGGVGAAGTVIPPSATPANAANMQAIHGAPPPSHFGLTTVHAVEQDFFKQHQQQKFVQQIRPLAEVIGSGSFYFLQESELDSPDILTNAGNSVSSGNAGGIVFEPAPQPQQLPAPAGNLMNRVSDISQKQQQQQKGHVHGSDHKGGQSQQPQTILSQTFTNQTFPPIQQQQQQQQQQQSSLVKDSTTGSAVVSTVPRSAGNTTPNLIPNNSNAPSPMFQQQQPVSQQTHKQPLFSPVAIVQQQRQEKNIDLGTPNAAGSAGATSAVNQQQQQLTILQRLSTQTPSGLPAQQVVSNMPQSSSVATRSHGSGSGGFPFEHALVNSLGYDQQIVQQQLNVALKSSSTASSASDDKSMLVNVNPMEATTGIVNGWEATMKTGNVHSKTSNVLANPLKQNNGSSSNANDSSINKWSTEMNAMSSGGGGSNAPVGGSGGVSQSTSVSNPSGRKNDWASNSGSNYGSADMSSSESNNHWSGHQMQDSGGGYGGRNAGRGTGGGGSGNYRRGNDERRRGRSNNNYVSGSNQQSQNSNGPRGSGGNSNSGGGNNNMYYRNNENTSNPHNQYYQNGIYGKESSRYDMGSGGNSYRPRTGGGGGGGGGGSGSSGPRNQTSRSMGGRSSTTSGNSNGTNNPGSGYMNARQANRMSLGAENKN